MMPLFPKPQSDYVSRAAAVASGGLYRYLTGQAPTHVSAAWASANQAVYVPMYTEYDMNVRGVYVANGSAVSGNFDIGIYLPDAEGKPGAAIHRKGATAQASTNYPQGANALDLAIPKGLFYIGYSLNNTTGQVLSMFTAAVNGSGVVMASVFTEAAAHPLPANATPSVSFVAAVVPVVHVWRA